MASWASIIEIVKSIMEIVMATRKIVTMVQEHHALSLGENMKNLERKMEELKSREDGINIELQQGKKQKREVEVWLEKKQKVTTDVKDMKEKVGKRRYFSGLWWGKLVAKKIEEVNELLDKYPFADGLTLATTTLVGEAARRNLKIIWEYMLNDDINKIGVYGMGGVGKTTTMTHINNKLKHNGHFDAIIWVIVSKARNLQGLQNDIAHAIDLNLSNYSDPKRRANKLQEELKRKKRFVLILDDMWEVFSLEEIGIPTPCRENGCKLVLTSRSFEVCRRMNCHREIKVEVLSEEEAWNLFMDKVRRDDTVLAPEVEEIARLVAQECACLPLTIITVGRTMRGVEDIHEWRNALYELESSTKGVRRMKDNVIERLKFSYNWLRGEKVRTCFLYCALYPEDYKILVQELIEFWIAERLIDDDERNRQARVDEGHVILNILINNGMLERIIDDWNRRNIECVKMHDSIRDMALDITSASPRFMVEAGDKLIKKPPKEEKWGEDLERVSLMRNDIMELSYTPRCPILTTLLLQGNPLSKGISDSFFEHMPNLRVLDLSKTKIKHLPHSISDLKNLRALLLRNCHYLTYVPSLQNLAELRVLDLHSTCIKEFPQGMRRLVNLRRLDLSSIDGPRMFPSGLLSMLSFLEDLKIADPGLSYEMGTIMVEGACVEELMMNLTHLEILYAGFSDLHTFNKYVRSEHVQQLKEFHLSVGANPIEYIDTLMHEKFVSVLGVNLIDGNMSLVLPHNIQELCIANCNDLTRLSELYCLKNARDLKHCKIISCNGIECILSLEDKEAGTLLLPSLENLSLYSLDKLSALYKGVVSCDILSSLKELDMYKCNHIENLFSPGLLQHLQSLEYVHVRHCEQMEEIIAEEEEMGEGSNNTITLPRLKKLKLEDLRKLKSIWKGLMVCDSLQIIHVFKCEEMKRLPLSMEMKNRRRPPPPLPALKEIEGSKEWWDSLEWDHPNDKTLLQPFFKRPASDL